MFRKPILRARPRVRVPIAAHACSACGCLLTGDWSVEGLAVEPRRAVPCRFPLRSPRSGRTKRRHAPHRSRRDPATHRPRDRAAHDQQLRNARPRLRQLPNGGVRVVVPFVIRDHRTVAPGDTDISTSATRDLGDVRLIARFQGLPTKSLIGVEFGVKLPTGGFGDTFFRGPQTGGLVDRGLAGGQRRDRGDLRPLQLRPPHRAHVDYFVHAQGQTPDHTPGRISAPERSSTPVRASARASAGSNPNCRRSCASRRRTTGIASDRDNSGGTLVDLAPGCGLPRLGARAASTA